MTSDDMLPAAESTSDGKEPLPLAEQATEFEPDKDRRPHIPLPPPVNLVAVEDVRLPALVRQRPLLDEFYLDMLGFRAEDFGDSPGLIAYRAENFRLIFELHAEHFERLSMRPLGLIVPSLPQLEEQLRQRQIAYTRQRSLVPGRENLLLQDPAGNWLEIDQVRLV